MPLSPLISAANPLSAAERDVAAMRGAIMLNPKDGRAAPFSNTGRLSGCAAAPISLRNAPFGIIVSASRTTRKRKRSFSLQISG